MTPQQIATIVLGAITIIALIIIGMLWAASDRAFDQRQAELMEKVRNLSH
jgi:hypothetical protein